ncbi:MAG: HAMP domain-containing sensor histidine kinase [Actinomycetota bacterium]|nr:HAMP domain-containing sensor histidine kinase [Actinomycetota bacterium]
MRFWRPGASKWDRALGITLVAGVAMLLLVGLVFAIAYGSQRITRDAKSLHNADEILRSSTVVRAQLSLGVHAGEVDSHFGINSSEAMSLSLEETGQALEDLDLALQALVSDGIEIGDIQDRVESFSAAARKVIALMEAGDTEGASAVVADDVGPGFNRLGSSVVVVRNGLADTVRSSDVLLSQIGNVAGFLVAFLLPAAVIFIYRDLLRRQARQAELESRLEAARQISEAREEFIANASHELRTPLTSITGLAMLLAEVPTIREDPASAELLDLMISESVDLNRMVEDLLTAARLDAGALSYTFQDVSPDIEVEEVAGSLRRAGVPVEAACEPAQLRADAVRLRQIIRNLLSNANKYGGPRIRVLGYVEGRTYVCEVIDNGEGVPDEIADRVFQRFVHQGQQTAVMGSVGLGLSIVHALTRGMGGSASYRRSNGETHFAIRMPLAHSSEALSVPGLARAEPDQLTA